ncbi:MAG: 8-amino-7-oxononanoate synthase [Myxococcota bacterium]|nr:8-amino-7-oxononanoate synthase [Myxococcota bacterium]
MSRISANAWFRDQCDAIRAAGLERRLRRVAGAHAAVMSLDGQRVINLCGNDYLGLASHPRLAEAMISGARESGSGSGSSRLIAGNNRLHEILEQSLAEWQQEDACLLFNSGYHANTGILPALAREGHVIFSDELNHASLVDGCRLSRARTVVYRHGDLGDLEDRIKANPAEVRWLATESLFSMDGDIPNLAALAELCVRHGVWPIVDEAHAVGAIGPEGQGAAAEAGVSGAFVARVGTMGKAFGTFGSFVCGGADLRAFLINRARTFIFTTGLPPPLMSASLEALRIIRSGEDLRQRLKRNIQCFAQALREHDLPAPERPSHIIPLIVGDPGPTMELCQQLLRRGVYAQGIRPPTVPAGKCRIRFSISASHGEEDLIFAARQITAAWREKDGVRAFS